MMTVNHAGPQPSTAFWEVYEQLDADLAALHADWALFRQLYGRNAVRIDLLNRVAASFFYRLQWIMLRDVISSVSRLLDPPRMGKRENLVLEQLIEQLTDASHRTLRDKLGSSLISIRAMADPLRTYRHKRVAHRDKHVAIGLEALPDISRQLVEDTLDSIREFMNVIQLRFRNQTKAWQHTSMIADGDVLVVALKRAVAYGDLVKARTIPRLPRDKLPFGEA